MIIVKDCTTKSRYIGEYKNIRFIVRKVECIAHYWALELGESIWFFSTKKRAIAFAKMNIDLNT